MSFKKMLFIINYYLWWQYFCITAVLKEDIADSSDLQRADLNWFKSEAFFSKLCEVLSGQWWGCCTESTVWRCEMCRSSFVRWDISPPPADPRPVSKPALLSELTEKDSGCVLIAVSVHLNMHRQNFLLSSCGVYLLLYYETIATFFLCPLCVTASP